MTSKINVYAGEIDESFVIKSIATDIRQKTKKLHLQRHKLNESLNGPIIHSQNVSFTTDLVLHSPNTRLVACLHGLHILATASTSN